MGTLGGGVARHPRVEWARTDETNRRNDSFAIEVRLAFARATLCSNPLRALSRTTHKPGTRRRSSCAPRATAPRAPSCTRRPCLVLSITVRARATPCHEMIRQPRCVLAVALTALRGSRSSREAGRSGLTRLPGAVRRPHRARAAGWPIGPGPRLDLAARAHTDYTAARAWGVVSGAGDRPPQNHGT